MSTLPMTHWVSFAFDPALSPKLNNPALKSLVHLVNLHKFTGIKISKLVQREAVLLLSSILHSATVPTNNPSGKALFFQGKRKEMKTVKLH